MRSRVWCVVQGRELIARILDATATALLVCLNQVENALEYVRPAPPIPQELVNQIFGRIKADLPPKPTLYQPSQVDLLAADMAARTLRPWFLVPASAQDNSQGTATNQLRAMCPPVGYETRPRGIYQ